MPSPRNGINPSDLARRIDHTLLRPTATSAEFIKLFDEALKYGFWSVCVPPSRVAMAVERLKGTPVKVCAVVGFPLGYSCAATKRGEARRAIAEGADEVDMVMNIGAFKGGELSTVRKEIGDISEACKARGRTLKVIIECCYLTDEEKVAAARMAERMGADYVKTSTGFGPGGATAEDVALLHRSLAGAAKVKASGGISTLAKALEMIGAGADRIGTSSGAAIMEGLPGSSRAPRVRRR